MRVFVTKTTLYFCISELFACLSLSWSVTCAPQMQRYVVQRALTLMDGRSAGLGSAACVKCVSKHQQHEAKTMSQKANETVGGCRLNAPFDRICFHSAWNNHRGTAVVAVSICRCKVQPLDYNVFLICPEDFLWSHSCEEEVPALDRLFSFDSPSLHFRCFQIFLWLRCKYLHQALKRQKLWLSSFSSSCVSRLSEAAEHTLAWHPCLKWTDTINPRDSRDLLTEHDKVSAGAHRYTWPVALEQRGVLIAYTYSLCREKEADVQHLHLDWRHEHALVLFKELL